METLAVLLDKAIHIYKGTSKLELACTTAYVAEDDSVQDSAVVEEHAETHCNTRSQ